MKYILVILFIILLIILFKNNNRLYGGQLININHLYLKKCCDILHIKYILSGRYMEIYHNNISIKFKNGLNNLPRRIKYTNSKVSISNILNTNNLPVPKSIMFNKITDINYINYIIENNTINYPLVLKPIDGIDAHNVYTHIQNKEQLKNILIEHFLNKNIKHTKSKKIMLEEHLFGKQYRVLIYKDTIIDILEMNPPFIIGDGIHTIKELVYNINNIRYNTNKTLYSINKNLLKSYNLTENSILKKYKKYIINLPKGRLGATYKRINIKNVHIDNINMFKNIYNYVGFDLIGLDIIFNNIKKSYKSSINKNSGINEVNSSPALSPHCKGQGLKYSLQVPITFLKLYFHIM